MAGGEFNPLILRTLKDEFLTDPRVRRVVAAFREGLGASEPVDFQRQIAHLTLADDERAFLAGVALEESPEPNEKGVERLLKDLEKKYLERESAEIQREIDRTDETAGEELARLIRRKEDISRRRSELGR